MLIRGNREGVYREMRVEIQVMNGAWDEWMDGRVDEGEHGFYNTNFNVHDNDLITITFAITFRA